MALSSSERKLLGVAGLLLVVAAVLTVVGATVLGVLLVESLVIAIGLYFIIKFAVKAALSEVRVKIDEE